MAVTFKANRTIKINGSDVNFKSGETALEGKVLNIQTREIQIMSDVWGWATFVEYANDDGSTSEFGIYEDADCVAKIDATEEVKALVNLRISELEGAFKAVNSAIKNLEYQKPRLGRDRKAKVVKGRKVKIGTEVDVFWVGTVYNKFNGNREERAGIKVNGETVWVNAANLQVIPTEQEKIELAAAKVELTAALKNEAKLCQKWGTTQFYQHAELTNA